MDSRDGFDIEGLPLEPELWAAQQLQGDHILSTHSSHPSSLYQSHIPQVTSRDYAPMSLAPSFSAGTSSYAHSQQLMFSQGQQSSHPAMTKNPTNMNNLASSQSTSADRSAWSHLYSLDPALASMNNLGTQSSQRLPQRYSPMEMLSSHKQHGDLSTSFSRANAQPTIPNVGLPGTHFPVSSNSFHQSEYPPYTHHSLIRDRATSQLNQMMSVPKTNMIPNMQTLTVDTNVPLMQPSSYSPISPTGPDAPSTDFGQSTPRIAEFLLKSSQHPNMMSQITQMSSCFPNEVRRSSLDHRPEKFGSNSTISPDTLDLSSQSLPSNTPSLLSPSDMPIDMTTALNSRTSSVKQQSDDYVKRNSEANKGVSNVSADVDIGTNFNPLLQGLLTKSAAAGLDQNKTQNSSDIPIVTSTVRTQPTLTMPLPLVGKPPKSTLKKSDFYGRDASLFSFTNDPINTEPVDASSHSPLSTGLNGSGGESRNKNTIPLTSNTVIKPNVLAIVKNQFGNSLKEDQQKVISETTFKIDEPDLSPTNEDFSITDKSSDLSPSFEHSADSFIEACIAKDVPETVATQPALETNVNSETKKTDEKTEVKKDEITFKNSPETFSDESNATIIDLNEDLENEKSKVPISLPDPEPFEPVIIPSVVSKRGGRGKKKRGGGRGRGTTRKRGGKRVGGAAAILKNLEIDMVLPNGETLDTNTESLSESLPQNQEEDKEPEPQDLQSKEEESKDKAPRRVSSRKSKDTAKRLIELQADSGYSGGVQTTEDTKTSAPTADGRKGRKRKLPTYAEEESDGSINDESTDDGEAVDKDVDYILDEEEAAVDEKEEAMDESPAKRTTRDKKGGGLKISIKLGNNANAEIVSGITTGTKKKKKKVEKVKEADKSPKTMKKRKVAKTVAMIYTDDETESETDQAEKNESGKDDKNVKNDEKDVGENKVKDTSNDKTEKSEDKESEDLESSNQNEEESETLPSSKKQVGEQKDDKKKLDGKPLSLMEKYFSVANSATAAKIAKMNDTPTKKKSQQNKKKVKSNIKKHESANRAESDVGEVKKTDTKKVLKQKGSVKDETNDAEIDVPKFVCGYCPQRFHNKQDLLAHVVDHMNEMEEDDPKSKPISKDTKEPKKGSEKSAPGGSDKAPPNKALPKPSSNSIKGNKDQTVEKQKFKCGECGEVFQTKLTLLEHVRIHTADKPFECDICHKCFTERNMLSVHRKTHLQDALFRCQLCSKAFAHKSDLDTHMQSHPKRSGSGPLPKKTTPVPKSSDKMKNTNDKTDTPQTPASVKPKSFALALGGEPDVMILKRGESSNVNKSLSSNSKANEVQPVMKEKAVSITSSKLVEKNKSVTFTNVSKPSIGTDKVLNDIKAKPAETSDVCTCNECPECVTRFLASFD